MLQHNFTRLLYMYRRMYMREPYPMQSIPIFRINITLAPRNTGCLMFYIRNSKLSEKRLSTPLMVW